MGHQSRMRKGRKAETIHRKKLFGGRATAEEMHSKYGIRRRCSGCGQAASIRIKIFVPLLELTETCPEYVAGICATNPGGPYVPSTPMSLSGPNEPPTLMTKISDVAACAQCAPAAEKAAAKGPGVRFKGMAHLVEIDRGPSKTRALVAVPEEYGSGT
jgi:hypothetical protein